MCIQLENIDYTIGDAKILKDITLRMNNGLTAIIGPNGAGKTTLLRIISGYIAPTNGSAFLEGEAVLQMDMKERARRMALVPQNYAMEYDFSVLEIVLMGRNPHKKMFESDTSEDFKIAHTALEKAGILHLKNRSVIGLSGGEWQRMIVARALCQQANILLLDEPVSNLDIKHQTGIMQVVWQMVHQQQINAVCVLHDLNLAMSYCDSIVLMKNGRVVESGPPEQVMTKENIEQVYETKVEYIGNRDHTYIFPVMDK